MANNTSDDCIPSHLEKKRTIMKARIGCVRTAVCDLPGESFTYGMTNIKGAEGAGDGKCFVVNMFLDKSFITSFPPYVVLSNWTTANPSAVKVSQKMVVAQNILAIKKG